MSAVAVLSTGACAALLFFRYVQRRMPVFMWCGACCVGLTLHNIALFLNVYHFPDMNLRMARLIPALFGVGFLVYGAISDTNQARSRR